MESLRVLIPRVNIGGSMLVRRRFLATAAAGGMAGAVLPLLESPHAPDVVAAETTSLTGESQGAFKYLYRPMSKVVFPTARFAAPGAGLVSSAPSFSAAVGTSWQDISSMARLNSALTLTSLDNGFSGANLLDGTGTRAAYDLEFWHEGTHVAVMIVGFQGGDWHLHIDDQRVTADP